MNRSLRHEDNDHRLVVFRFRCSLWLRSIGPGREWRTAFSDETREPGFNIRFGVARDIAKGASLNILVSEPGVTMDQVHADDSSIVSIQATNTVYTETEDESRPTDTRITVVAQNVGKTRIHVTLDDGQTDYIDVNVSETTANEMEIYPWHDWVAGSSSLVQWFEVIAQYKPNRFGRARGAAGQPLTGC